MGQCQFLHSGILHRQIDNKDDNIQKQQSITDRQTDKIFTEQMLIYEENLHTKLELYLNQEPRKSRFPLNVVDGQTDGHTDRQTGRQTDIRTDRRTDICFYRVALLLKRQLDWQIDLQTNRVIAQVHGIVLVIKFWNPVQINRQFNRQFNKLLERQSVFSRSIKQCQFVHLCILDRYIDKQTVRQIDR